jgi:hypothetical protein
VLQRLKDVPEGIVGIKAIGKLTRDDYDTVLVPLLNDLQREGRRPRFLYELGPEFDSFAATAAWEDAKLGLRSLRAFAGCAIVSDREWIRESTRLVSFFLPCPVRAFSLKERAGAIAWLGSLPHEVGVRHRLLTERGVLVIEPLGALHVQDFDALALTVDPWIEAHGKLEGIVIHTRAFPGWENVGSFLRHVQFIRDHHRRVKRVALAADSKATTLVPRLGEHFVDAEVKPFAFDQLDAAVAWASGSEPS